LTVERQGLDAVGLALATEMLVRHKRREVIEAAYNRWASNDDPLPAWFHDEERHHREGTAPMTKEMVEEIKQRLREINTRPLKRVLEAKGRKRAKVSRLSNKLNKQAETVADNDTITGSFGGGGGGICFAYAPTCLSLRSQPQPARASSCRTRKVAAAPAALPQVPPRSGREGERWPPEFSALGHAPGRPTDGCMRRQRTTTYVVAKRHQAGKRAVRPKGVTGRYQQVDRRLKSDKRGLKVSARRQKKRR
jgi:hypothetical protein